MKSSRNESCLGETGVGALVVGLRDFGCDEPILANAYGIDRHGEPWRTLALKMGSTRFACMRLSDYRTLTPSCAPGDLGGTMRGSRG